MSAYWEGLFFQLPNHRADYMNTNTNTYTNTNKNTNTNTITNMGTSGR